MYALSVKQPWAELIARGTKRIEYRSWNTHHRGDLLIVASKTPDEDGFADEDVEPGEVVYGAAVCVVEVTKVTGSDGDFKWHLARPRRVKPVPLRGYAALYTVPDAQIAFVEGKEPPVAKPRPRATPAMITERDVSSARNVLVLADDDAGRRRRIRALLADEGVEVKLVTSLASIFAMEEAPQWLAVSSTFEGGVYGDVFKRVRDVPALRRCKKVLLGGRGLVRDLAGATLVETAEGLAELVAPNEGVPEMLGR